MKIVRYISVFSFLCALITTLLGLMVIAGWYAQSVPLIQIYPVPS